MPACLIEVSHLKGSYRNGKVGDGLPLSFRLYAGEIGVLPGGRKARSVLYMLMGLGRITAGRVRVAGHTPQDLLKSKQSALRRRVGFAFRSDGLLSNLNLEQNVALPCLYHGLATGNNDARARAVRVMDELGIPSRYRQELPAAVPDETVKNTLLARAAVLDPELLVLDDPAAMIPWPRLPDLMQWIRARRDAGCAVLLSTENYPFGLALADWTLLPDETAVDYEFRRNLPAPWVAVAGLMEGEAHGT